MPPFTNFAEAVAVWERQELTIAEKNELIAKHLERIAYLERQLFGSKSEKRVDPEGTQLLPGMETVAAVAEPEKARPEAKVEARRSHRNQTGWKKLPKHLERKVTTVEMPASEFVDESGRALDMEFLDYQEIERLAWRNPFYVEVTRLERYIVRMADGSCYVKTAPHPGDYFGGKSGKTQFAASAIAHFVASKAVDHIPLYRMEQMLERLGIESCRSTLNRLFGQTAQLLLPIYGLLEVEIDACPVIHADETWMNLIEKARGKCKKAWMWCKMSGVGPPGVFFRFATGRDSEQAKKLFTDFSGTLVADQYAAYNSLFDAENSTIEHAGCWAHVRRKFIYAQNNSPLAAAQAITLIRKLYLFERRAKELTAEQPDADEATLFATRRKIRAEESRRVVDAFFKLCKEIAAAHGPSESAAKAVAYALNAEKSLRRFLADPRINIDNNPAENVIRPLALGRKNWMFAGSEDGGQNLAIIFSITETCKMHGINPREYLEDAIRRLADTPPEHYRQLLPWEWKRLRDEAARTNESAEEADVAD